MAKYTYVDNTGKSQTIEAADAATAQSSATNIGKNSGVMLMRSAQTTEPTYQSGSTGAGAVPTPSTPTPPLGDRANATLGAVDPLATTSPITQAKQKIANIFSSVPEAPDEKAILASKQNAAQLLVNEINSEYTKKYSSANQANTGREARVRALNSNAGLSGSNVGASNTEKAANVSKENIDMLDNEKNARIQEVLGRISDQSSDEYRKRRAEYLAEVEGNYEKLNEFQTAELQTAKANMQQLASSGVPLSSLKTSAPDTYKSLLEQSGMDPVIFAAAYNAGLPENQKITYSYEKIGNDLYAIHTDPVTNKHVTEKISTPQDGEAYDKFMIAPDGTPLFINTKTGKYTEGAGSYAKATSGGSSTNTSTEPTAADKRSALIWLRSQPDFTKEDEDAFNNDKVVQAMIITAAKKKVTTPNP